MSNKLSLKQEKPRKDVLKGPDEFQQYVAKAAEFFKVYGTRIAIGAGVVVIVITTTVIVSKVSQASHINKSTEFQKHLDMVTAQVLPSASMDRLPVPDRNQLETSRQALAKFVEENKGSDIAGMAEVARGIAALQAGDAKGAVEILKPVMDDKNIGQAVSDVALQAYATACDIAGIRDQAVAAYEKIAAAGGNMTRAYAYMSLGDIFNPAMAAAGEQGADKARAREYYDKGTESLAEQNGMEALVLQNSIKARIAGLN